MNQKKPLKHFLVSIVILLALIMGAYLLRTTLITRSVNILLASADVRVLQLGTLQLGWSDLHVDQMVVGVGPDDTPQTLHGVRLEYSLLELQPNSLAIERAVLSLPQQVEEAGSSPPPLLLSQLLGMVFTLPLQAIAVEQLEVAGLTHPLIKQPLLLSASLSEGSVSLQGSDRDKELVLELQQVGPNEFRLEATLSKDHATVIEFALALSEKSGSMDVKGAGELLVSAALPMLKPALAPLDIVSQGAGQIFYQISVELEDDLAQWATAHGTIQIMPTTQLTAELTGEGLSASIQLLMASPAHVSLQLDSSHSLGGSFAVDAASLQIREASSSLQGNIDLSELECSLLGALQCRAGLSLAMNTAHFEVPTKTGLALTDLKLDVAGQFSLQDSVLSGKIAAGEWLCAGSVVQDGLVVSGPALIGDKQGSFNYDIASGAMNLDVAALRLLVPRAEMPELSLATVLQLEKLMLSGDGGGALEASFHMSSNALNIQIPEQWLPVLAFEAEVIVADEALSFDGLVRGGGQQPLLRVDMNYKLQQQSGRARLTSGKLNFDADEMRLSKHFSSWPFEWDVLAGSMELDSTVQWRGAGSAFELVADIRQDMEGIAGVYEDIGVVGLTAELLLQFQSPDRLKTVQTASISVDSAHVGVPIEAIEARIQFDSGDQSVALDSVQAKLFGGRVWIEEAVYHADQAHNKLFVGVDGVQLGQLLQHAGYDAVQATGSISGLLPLDVNSAGATMKRGMLAAKAPGGLFRYSAEVTTDIDSTVAPVLAALENYHYDVFQLEADYLDDGELQLAMIFRGSNPQVQQGRPIHLNLNVTDNIPALLKSLQSSRRITEAVEKKLGGR